MYVELHIKFAINLWVKFLLRGMDTLTKEAFKEDPISKGA